MTTPQSPFSLSRRALLAGVGVGTFSLAAHQHLATFAQEASPVADIPRFEHAINGVWQWNTNPGNHVDSITGTFYSTGAYLEYDPIHGLGLGFWRASSAQLAEAVLLYQLLDGSWADLSGPVEMFEPGYVPIHPEFSQGHIVRYRHTLTVNNAGDALSASGFWDVFDLDDKVTVWAESLTRTAKRMRVP